MNIYTIQNMLELGLILITCYAENINTDKTFI